MATERNISDAAERLNALIDGELPPAEHAALADRIAAGRDLAQAHATLARLKACIVQSAEQTDASGIVLPKKQSWLLPAGVAGLAVAAALLLAVFVWRSEPQPETPQARIAPLVTLASLPAAPVIPDLAHAGLNFVGGEIEHIGGTAIMVAAYRGSRGCRLELRVHRAANELPPTAGTSRAAWVAGSLGYELVAFGMPVGRFAAVAAAAEAATRAGQMPPDADTRLREASLKAPPCLG